MLASMDIQASEKRNNFFRVPKMFKGSKQSATSSNTMTNVNEVVAAANSIDSSNYEDLPFVSTVTEVSCIPFVESEIPTESNELQQAISRIGALSIERNLAQGQCKQLQREFGILERNKNDLEADLHFSFEQTTQQQSMINQLTTQKNNFQVQLTALQNQSQSQNRELTEKIRQQQSQIVLLQTKLANTEKNSEGLQVQIDSQQDYDKKLQSNYLARSLGIGLGAGIVVGYVIAKIKK
jgi:septal ring factor EnvC (AmiA/AmiB activator)